MFDCTVQLVGRFAYAQEVRYTVPACTIGLNISGLRRVRIGGAEVREPGPFLSISPAGLEADFTYGPDRENWAMVVDTSHVRVGATTATVEIREGAHWIAVPGVVLLAPEQIPPWQEEFLRLYDAFRDPLPASRLRLRLGMAALLRPFLDQGQPRSTTPAARLKRLIDDDRQCRETITRLSSRCGFHPDHLRTLFVAAYGLTPVAYRGRRRLAIAMDLIGSSGYGVGEIGRRIGFEHVSHFSAFFTKAAGMGPRQAIARYRNRQG